VTGRQRIDKWLWFARMVKTRPLAVATVSQGQVRVNKIRVMKASHEVEAGDIITLAAHGRVRVLRVLALAPRRGPASEAQSLYQEVTGSKGGSGVS
jgi:ribosome-associated heat shock protein Hsp15